MSFTPGYSVSAGQKTGDLSSTSAIVAAPGAGRTLSIKSIALNCGATAQNITIENSDGTDIIGPIYLPINGVFPQMQYAPGVFKANAANASINVVASGSANMTAVVECYVL